ncbi:MAG: V-type ATP synthase subunit D [bacterium]|nr:V-type ATP synthase subunit D [bacterium]
MILKVNPTRISLLNLKKELRLALRGHKLLKDKRDGLMKHFMKVIRETAALRQKVEKALSPCFYEYAKAKALMGEKAMDSVFLLPGATMSLEVKIHNLMSVAIPKFDFKKTGSFLSYGRLDTNSNLDKAISLLDGLISDLITLAEMEKTVESLAFEIERTRRRASALENTRIPNLKDTIRFITSRLEEQARDAVVGTMLIKAMILQKEKVMS